VFGAKVKAIQCPLKSDDLTNVMWELYDKVYILRLEKAPFKVKTEREFGILTIGKTPYT
jgi:hypothetical protein